MSVKLKKTSSVLVALFAVIVSVSMFFACGTNKVAAEESYIDTYGAFSYLENFVTNFPDRTSGSAEGQKAAEYLANTLQNMGYEPSLRPFSYVNTYNKDAPEQSVNVVARKNAAVETKKTVVLAAHHDTYTNISGSQGAYNNGSGVAVVLALAENLMRKSFDFNIEFAFFGATERGLWGSREYFKNLTVEEKDNILLMVNFDSVAGGDYLYYYADETTRIHESAFADLAKQKSAPVLKMPKSSNLIMLTDTVTGLPYTHLGTQGDNAYFYGYGINTLSFFSCNLDMTQDAVVRESSSHKNIAGTSSDTLDQILQYYGNDVGIKLNSLTGIMSDFLSTDNFIATMEESKAHRPDHGFFSNSWYILGLSLGMGALFSIGFYFVVKLLKKKEDAVLSDSEKMSDEDLKKMFSSYGMPINPNPAPPQADDVFEETKEQKGKDDDDIFGDF